MSEKGIIVNGLVLRTVDYKENDKIVTVLTNEKGKITFRANGIKSLRNKNRPACRPFTYSEFVLSERNGYYSLSESSVKNMFPGIEKELESMYLAYYVCEAVDFVCMDEAVEEDILKLALNVLYALSEKLADTDTLKTVFESRLLLCLGTLPPLDGCSECGGYNGGLYFSVNDGSVVCHECLESGNRQDYEKLTDEAALFIKYESVCDPKKIIGPYRPDECAAKIIEKYLLFSLHHSFTSLRQYKDIREM